MQLILELSDEQYSSLMNFKNCVVDDKDSLVEENNFFLSCLILGARTMERNLIERTAQVIRDNPSVVLDMAKSAGVPPEEVDLTRFGIQEELVIGELGPVLVNKSIQ